MSDNIEGKVVVITGASSGLGEATARLLSAEGASVVLGARRVERIQSLADELTGSGGKALAVTTDVTRFDPVKRLVDAAVETYGRIDVMLNNAGLMPHSPLERLKVEDWERRRPVQSFCPPITDGTEERSYLERSRVRLLPHLLGSKKDMRARSIRPPPLHLPSSRQATWMLLQREELNDEQQSIVEKLCQRGCDECFEIRVE